MSTMHQSPEATVSDDDKESPEAYGDEEEERSMRLRLLSESKVTEDHDPFMGMKVRRTASLRGDYKGDYLDVLSHPFLVKILQKQVLFADKVLKFTASGKMKRRILLITDFTMYIVDPEMDALKRRIALAAVDSSRKTEIATVLVESTKNASDYELEVVFSNRFEYHASSDMVKEVQFEEVEGSVKTGIAKK